MTDYRPCPFCGSAQIRELDITISGDDGDEDVLAVECLMCDAQARAEWWNERRTPEQAWQQQLCAQANSDEPELDI